MPCVKASSRVHFLLFGSLVLSAAGTVSQIQNGVHFVHDFPGGVVVTFEVVYFVCCVWMEKTWVT